MRLSGNSGVAEGLRIVAILLGVAGLALLGGCSTGPASSLSMVSNDQKRCFDQDFQHAYLSRTADGDVNVFLVHDSQTEASAGNPDGTLAPAHVSPRQVVQIRIFWMPMGNMSLDHPAATNAAIHWYVFGDQNDHSDCVQYTGVGYVDVDESHTVAKVRIRNASMDPMPVRGSMCDPMGPSTLNGKAVAIEDNQAVADLVAELKEANSDPSQQAASAGTNVAQPVER
jgi:hypothetical protein